MLILFTFIWFHNLLQKSGKQKCDIIDSWNFSFALKMTVLFGKSLIFWDKLFVLLIQFIINFFQFLNICFQHRQILVWGLLQNFRRTFLLLDIFCHIFWTFYIFLFIMFIFFLWTFMYHFTFVIVCLDLCWKSGNCIFSNDISFHNLFLNPFMNLNTSFKISYFFLQLAISFQNGFSFWRLIFQLTDKLIVLEKS